MTSEQIALDTCECTHLTCEHAWDSGGFLGRCTVDGCRCLFWRHVHDVQGR